MENTYTSISEAIYYATHNENDEEIIIEKQPEWIEFDLKPIIDLALDTNDEEWFNQLIGL